MHYSEESPNKPAQEVSYVQNQQQRNYNHNTGYQNLQSGTSYPSSSFNTNTYGFGGNRFSRFSNQQNANAELREIMNDLISAQKATNEKVEEQSKKITSAWDSMTTRLDGLNHKLEQSTKSTHATFQDIEAKLERLGNSNRQPGTLPSNTQQNPKHQQNNQGSGSKYSHPNVRNEQVNAITIRAGNTYNSANPLPSDITPLAQVEADEAVDDEIEMEPNPAVKTPTVPSKTVEKTTFEKPPVTPYQLKIPFPQRLWKAMIKENFKKYAKLCKVSKGTHLGQEEALADLGASINLMPYSVYKKLSLVALTPTRTSIRLVNPSFQYPMGIAKDLQIKVGHMIFLVDFVILEMEADVNVPLILGRPFLMTADAIIQVKDKEISLGVADDRVIFDVDRALKHPYSCDESCFRIDVVEEEDALEKELMDFLDTEEGEALLACSEEEQELVGEMVQEIMALSIDKTPLEDETFEEITISGSTRVLTSVENPPIDLELKLLPDHLEYAYLEGTSFLPVVISSSLMED
uniref:uncharacterized protein LOC122584853 n=1 Tax=Erigeron canadensis TaxID=72917 RepID=UPI001CB94A49|nr:uncharacterized protein LOC122584853 [Erigeron canadensis]